MQKSHQYTTLVNWVHDSKADAAKICNLCIMRCNSCDFCREDSTEYVKSYGILHITMEERVSEKLKWSFAINVKAKISLYQCCLFVR